MHVFLYGTTPGCGAPMMPSSAGGGAGGGAVILVSRMPSPSIMACVPDVHSLFKGLSRASPVAAASEQWNHRSPKAHAVRRKPLPAGCARVNWLQEADRPVRAGRPEVIRLDGVSHASTGTRTSSTPPNAADLAADRAPVRSCRKPPVSAPALIEFHGSSCSSGARRCVSHCHSRCAAQVPAQRHNCPSTTSLDVWRQSPLQLPPPAHLLCELISQLEFVAPFS